MSNTEMICHLSSSLLADFGYQVGNKLYSTSIMLLSYKSTNPILFKSNVSTQIAAQAINNYARDTVAKFPFDILF